MVLVAMEQHFPRDERIVNDDLALPMLPFGYRIQVWLLGPFTKWIIKKTEQKVPGLWGSIMSRKCYIDDRVVEDVGEVETLVNLGAGFDTRPFRLPALAEVPVWEIDQPRNIKAKAARIEKLFKSIPKNLTLVPIDFDREDLGAVLAAHGYSREKRTFFIWEGVTQYVSEGGVRATMEFLGEAPAGSKLVLTYTPKDFIDGENLYGQQYLYQQMLTRNRTWLFGLDPDRVEGFLGGYGWRIVEHLGYDELVHQYVKPTSRDLGPMAIERIVSAEKA